MFSSGYLTLGRIRGAAVRLHWSILLVALLFGGYPPNPGFLLGYVALVLVHELGHAILVWRARYRVLSIEATGLGGACTYTGGPTEYEQAGIAWGGVLAQGVLYLATQASVALLGPPTTALWAGVVASFLGPNLWLIALNLLPIPPLDGAQAWQVFRLWRERGRRGVPAGSWRDARWDTQRGWWQRLAQTRPPPRHRVPRREPEPLAAEVDPLRSGALPSAEAQQVIDDLIRRSMERLDEDEKG